MSHDINRDPNTRLQAIRIRNQGECPVLIKTTVRSGIGSLFSLHPREVPQALSVTSSVKAADAIIDSGKARHLSLRITGLVPDSSFLIESLDKTHGNVVRSWEMMGQPETPTREQTQALRSLAWATNKQLLRVDSSGTLLLDRELEPWVGPASGTTMRKRIVCSLACSQG